MNKDFVPVLAAVAGYVLREPFGAELIVHDPAQRGRFDFKVFADNAQGEVSQVARVAVNEVVGNGIITRHLTCPSTVRNYPEAQPVFAHCASAVCGCCFAFFDASRFAFLDDIPDIASSF
jgi:hypothetical protein